MPPQNHVLPAIIAQNQQELDQMLELIPFADNIMLDLMDEKFVGATSLDFPMTLPDGSRYQLHIMAVDPLERIKNLPPQIDTVILHAEILDNISEAIDQTKEKGLNLFIALNPETPISEIEPYLDSLDGVLIMSVHPGQYGAKFLPDQLEKVRKLREESSEINLEVDGGMSDKTIGLAVAAGANMIASGSFIMKCNDPEAAYNILSMFFK
jgi:ribulose-phosphate 3-epimerase